jgi:hypothetical protein
VQRIKRQSKPLALERLHIILVRWSSRLLHYTLAVTLIQTPRPLRACSMSIPLVDGMTISVVRGRHPQNRSALFILAVGRAGQEEVARHVGKGIEGVDE